MYLFMYIYIYIDTVCIELHIYRVDPCILHPYLLQLRGAQTGLRSAALGGSIYIYIYTVCIYIYIGGTLASIYIDIVTVC